MNLSPLSPAEIILSFGLLVACYTDLTQGKIPNRLNLFLVVAGLVVALFQGGLFFAIQGMIIAFAVHFTFWMLNIEKGGDAKLMVGLGTLVGWSEMVETTFLKLFVMVPYGIYLLIHRERMTRFLLNLRSARIALPENQRTMTPFAPFIALGWILARITDWVKFWG